MRRINCRTVPTGHHLVLRGRKLRYGGYAFAPPVDMTASSRTVVRAAVLLALLASATAGCPFALRQGAAVDDATSGRRLLQETTAINSAPDGGAVPEGGFEAVQEDLKAFFTDSQAFWPADFGNYGPFMIRLAWHCSGTYRTSDGRGGCDGGRIRFSPELSWMDNGNLDKALALLQPIKDKYDASLSWGDLIILAGTTAIEFMGGKTLGFCGGRVDDVDGMASIPLGRSDYQEAIAPCPVDGACEAPLGQTTLGLIYVNPQGPMGQPDINGSALDIETSFGRMGLNFSETVAFIGGGHAFGKNHGACLDPPCDNGTYTSGLEGSWTTRPTEWTNEYFTNLLNFEWEVGTGPGGLYQWAPKTADGSEGPPVVMLTSDLALANHPNFAPYVEKWAADIADLEDAFAAVWYRVTSADMGPAVRCMGDLVAPPQPWQGGLPPMPMSMPDYAAAEADIQDVIAADPANAAMLMDLAYKCASTYRATDNKGGCNGARVRLSPESEWPENAGTADALALLQPIKSAYADMSWADLIVLAGTKSVQESTGMDTAFCGGRVDVDSNGEYSHDLAPRHYSPMSVSLEDDMRVKGLEPREYIALMGGLHSGAIAGNFTERLALGVDHFEQLLSNSSYGTAMERALNDNPEWVLIMEEFRDDEEAFKTELSAAWTKLMNADRYETNCSARAFSAPPSVSWSRWAFLLPQPLIQASLGAMIKQRLEIVGQAPAACAKSSDVAMELVYLQDQVDVAAPVRMVIHSLALTFDD
eukprot:jgi/Tetstr1/459361/TSEL_000429.t2